MSDTNIHALPVGHTFDGYRILRLLGAGGFGITYLAEEVQIGRKVAIKEYLPQGFAARAIDSFSVRPVSATAKEQFTWGLARFRQEATTLVAFEHPNIVSVFRYFEANGTAYLVMQYVEGKPLDALLAGGNTLAESEILEAILPILAGLEQVHAAKFLHRDIKPANIYIRHDGRPVLLDFGAARQAFGSETRSITAIVSEGYAPFEQYEAKGDQGPWTDVYALGAVLYRCLSGQRPPAATERVSARLRGVPDPMPSAREVGAERYSARLLAATDRALAVMPPDRAQSIGELRQLLGGEGSARIADRGGTRVATTAATMMAGAAKPKSRWPLAAGIVGVLAAGSAAAFFALGSGEQKTTGGPAVTPKQPPTTVSANPPTQDEIAEREASTEAARAEHELAEAKAALQQGNLERAREDLKAVLRQLDQALKKRPNHAGLMRASAAARAAETELGARIAARVKELVETAEREAVRNYGEAMRLLAEAERLDPAATKVARERIEAARRSAEAEKERQVQIEIRLSQARYHFEQARTAATQARYAEARRLVEQAKVWLGRAMEVVASAPKSGGAVPAAVKDFTRDVEGFERDLAKRIAVRLAELLREARALIQAGKLDQVARPLEEAAELEPASADLAALRRELEEARKKPQTPPDPDAAERERTKTIVNDSFYDGRGRRGAAFFAFASSALTPAAFQMLVRGANAAAAQAGAQLVFNCSYDQLEAGDAAAGRKLAQERCDAAQRVAAQRGLGGRIRAALAPAGKGPEFRRVAFAVQALQPQEKPPEVVKAPDPRAPAGAVKLAGRTGSLSRISPERRAVMRIHLQFAAGGALGVSCVAELADGGQSGCFGAANGTGRWSLNGATLCLASPVINLAANTCYQVSGGGSQVTLAGPGLLAGVMFLR